MSKKSEETSRKQEKTTAGASLAAMGQLVLPLMLAAEATKNGLLAFVHQIGLMAMSELFASEAAAIVGPKGKHNEKRAHHHWGTTPVALPFGGRTIVLNRPRVRRRRGGEVPLPSVEAFRESDPIPERVAEQIVSGVSTRGYDRSLEPVGVDVRTRGTSKSSASRALIEKTSERLSEFLERRLEQVRLAGMFIDGISMAGKTVIIALGVTHDGIKVPLGLKAGSTENAVVATELLQNLIERGLRVTEPTLFVVDGGKGIRKGLSDVFGKHAVIQRCQVHKMRNVSEYLPDARRAYVMGQMRDAYANKNPKTARHQLHQLVNWLETNGEDSAAASLREGLEETLTITKLQVPKSLTRTFSTTNSIENMNGTLRRVTRNVKHWKGESMICRWIALGISEAERHFRRVKGYRNIPTLIAALRPQKIVETERKAA